MAREWNNVAVMRMLLIILIALCLAPMAQAQFISAYQFPTLNEVLDPTTNTVYSLGAYSVTWNFDNPASGGMHITILGAYSGDVLHVDQHTGNPGITNLVYLEAVDPDVMSLRVMHAGRDTVAVFTGGLVGMEALGVTGDITVSGTVDGVNVSAIPSTYLADTAAYALTILNNPVMTLIAIADSLDIQGSVRIDGGLTNDGRLGVGDVSDDYKIVMRGNGGATVFGFNTEASLHLISSYTSTFEYGADLSFGISSSSIENIIGGIRGVYTGITADSGLGGHLAFYTKNDFFSSTPELAMIIGQDKDVVIYGGINVAGNIVLGSGGGIITAGSGDEVITTIEGKLDGFALLANSVDDLAIDFGSGVNQVDLADIPGGIAPASVFDFGDATSLEIPAVDDPATTAEGHIAWDANDDAIEVYSGDEGESALIPIYHHIVLPLALPDSIQVYTPKLFLPKFNELMYPHGVEIDLIALSSDTTVSSISVVIEEWSGADPPVFQNIVTTISTVTETYAEEAPDTDGNLDANDVLVIVLPAGTGLNGYKIEIFFHVTAGN